MALRPLAEIIAGSGLMHSYHIVAKLRQFRGAFCRPNAQYRVAPVAKS
jgi:hypothetical protein